MNYSKFGLSLDIDQDIIVIKMSKHKTFLHIIRYMETYYGVKVNVFDSRINLIIFKEGTLDIFIDNYKVPTIEFGYIIENQETYNQFISVFTDLFYLTKYEQVVYPIKTKSSNGFYIGAEIEVDIGDKKFVDLVPKIKKEYLNYMIAKTELDDEFNIVEFCIFPTPMDDINIIIDIIRNLYEDVSNKSDRTNIHLHVTKEFIGVNDSAVVNNLKKIICFDANIDDVVKQMLQYGYSHETSSVTVLNEFDNNLIDYYSKKREEYVKNTDVRYYMHVNIYKLIHRMFNVNTVEFKWLVLNKENYFKLEEYMYLFIYYLNLIELPYNDVLKLTYDDFKRWYYDKKNRYTDKQLL